MLESDERLNPLLAEVAGLKKAQEEQRQSEGQALEMLPDFKFQLGRLITEKVPAPKVITEKVTSFNMFGRDDDNSFGGRKRRELKTKLAATIPLEGGEATKVAISASAYPDLANPDSVNGLNYQIDVEGLDRILVIEGSVAKLQSKQWKSEQFTRYTPIGVPLRSWPAWERLARAEDIQEYQVLLEGMNQEGVTFEGATPPVIIRDYSEITAGIRYPKPR